MIHPPTVQTCRGQIAHQKIVKAARPATSESLPVNQLWNAAFRTKSFSNSTPTAPSSTGERNSLAFGRYETRWLIEISLDEDAHAQVPFPSNQPFGLWALACQSAAGMSSPIPVADHAGKGFPDNF